MGVKETFGSRLKELRGKMKQEELAGKLGISRASVGYYENGARTPDIEILEKVADYFKVSYDYLMGKTNSPNREAQDISELTGLSDKAIQNIITMYKEDGEYWSLRPLNDLLENKWVFVLLGRIRDYIYCIPDDYKIDIPGIGLVRGIEKMDFRSFLLSDIQNHLRDIMDKIRESNKKDNPRYYYDGADVRTWYMLIRAGLEQGKVNQDTFDKVKKQMYCGDYSYFMQEKDGDENATEK